MIHERICECGKRISIKCDEEERQRALLDEQKQKVKELWEAIDKAYWILHNELY